MISYIKNRLKEKRDPMGSFGSTRQSALPIHPWSSQIRLDWLWSLADFIYFLKYETIVRKSSWSFGHSDSYPSTVQRDIIFLSHRTFFCQFLTFFANQVVILSLDFCFCPCHGREGQWFFCHVTYQTKTFCMNLMLADQQKTK